MKPASKPQFASVEQPFGCDPPKPHCPLCGKAVLRIDDDGFEHPFGPAQTVRLGCVPCRVLAGAGGVALVLLAL